MLEFVNEAVFLIISFVSAQSQVTADMLLRPPSRGTLCGRPKPRSARPQYFLKGSRASEDPGYADVEDVFVEALVGAAEAAVGGVHVAVLHGEGGVVAPEILEAGADLAVEFTGGAKVGVGNIGRGKANAAIEKRDPAGAGGEVVAQERGGAGQVAAGRMKLPGTEDFLHEFPVAAVPFIQGDGVPEHHAVVNAAEHHVVGFLAADVIGADAGTEGGAQFFHVRPEAVTYALRRPDAGRFRGGQGGRIFGGGGGGGRPGRLGAKVQGEGRDGSNAEEYFIHAGGVV